MLGKSPNKTQRDAFRPLLTDFIDPGHELVLLANEIDWEYFESEFEELYSETDQPAMPIRFMVGCLLLKHLDNYGNETLAEAWIRDPYMQYFCGEAHFQHEFRCDPSDLVYFRNRIGKEGIEKIFSYSVQMHPHRTKGKYVLSDTTVQGNNTTFPTDGKLAGKVTRHCNRIANAEGASQRQSYVRVSKQLLRDSYRGKKGKRTQKTKEAVGELRTIAGRLIRELGRELDEHTLSIYEDDLALYRQAISQGRYDKDKVYSLHKPFTACIAKGKASNPYEFGNKVGLLYHPTQKIITAIKAFAGNVHDSKTIAPLLGQLEGRGEALPEEVVYDRGGRGAETIGNVTVTTPHKGSDQNEKRRLRRRFRRRAGIEGIISHLKSDHRMAENYLHGQDSPQINAMLAGAAWNMKKWMEKIERKGTNFFAWLYSLLFGPVKFLDWSS